MRYHLSLSRVGQQDPWSLLGVAACQLELEPISFHRDSENIEPKLLGAQACLRDPRLRRETSPSVDAKANELNLPVAQPDADWRIRYPRHDGTSSNDGFQAIATGVLG